MRLEFLEKDKFLLSQMALHDLCIGFSLSFRILRATTLTREFHSHTVDAWSHMFDRGEFDLKF